MAKNNWTWLFFAWLVAAVAMLGSLFFSDVMLYPPCTMCWYQRIAMYPLVFIFGVALFSYDKSVVKFSVPMVLIGWFFAFYHNLLHYEIITEEMTPCSMGVPCSVKYIEWFGFITIPMLSLIAFSMIAVSLVMIKRSENS